MPDIANPSTLREIPGAEGIWDSVYWDPDTHESTYAFLLRGCKGPLKPRCEEALEKYQSGEIEPCCYVERMVVFEMPRGGGVCIYSAIPMTDDLKAAVDAKGGVKVIVVPNQEHSKYHAGWVEAYPEAVVVCPGGAQMEPVIAELGDRAKVCDADTPAKWDKAAIKALNGLGMEIMDWVDFQEIILCHRKSKSVMSADMIYLGCGSKDKKEGWKNHPAEIWQELYFEAYCAKAPSFMPIYRTITLNKDQEKKIAKVAKKVIGWKPERVIGGRAGKVSEGGADEAKKLLEGHWGFTLASA
jgi:hypothetical protein